MYRSTVGRSLAITLLGLIGVLLVSCVFPVGPTATGVALPPPAKIDSTGHTASLHYLGVGSSNDSQIIQVYSNEFEVQYSQSDTAGASADEKITLTQRDREGLMSEIGWGAWEGSFIKTTEYYDFRGNLMGGLVTMSVDNASIFAWFKGRIDYTYDRSRLFLIYLPNPEGGPAQLRTIMYTERWGANNKAILALGQTALWRNPSFIPPQYQTWGFWETATGKRPFDMVTGALDATKAALNQNQVPDELIQDHDGAREFVLGRQTGFTIYQAGKPAGSIDLSYNNTFGRMPNTEAIARGSLSRIDWNLNGRAYSMLALTPQLSISPTTIYIFCDDPAACDSIATMQQNTWPDLYSQLRQGIPGVILAIHAIGEIREKTDTVSSGDSSSTVTIGAGGGIRYTTFGDPSATNIAVANNLLNYLGWGGIRALGLHYPTSANSGSGLNYYMKMLTIVTADDERALARWGYGVEQLDLVGFPRPMEQVVAGQ